MHALFVSFKKYYREFFPKRQQTVRYTFSLLLLMAAFTGLAAVLMHSGHTVRVITDAASGIGETIEIDVYANAVSPVNAVSIEIELPENQFEIIGINRGESVSTLWTKDPYAESGVVYLEGGTYRKGFIGEHKIATILAKPLQIGKVAVQVKNAKFYAGDGSGIEYSVENLVGLELVALDATTESSENTLAILADVNNDGRISLVDISIFMATWNSKERIVDLDRDGKMTFTDFSILLSLYFKQNP